MQALLASINIEVGSTITCNPPPAHVASNADRMLWLGDMMVMVMVMMHTKLVTRLVPCKECIGAEICTLKCSVQSRKKQVPTLPSCREAASLTSCAT
jgi:hypothetical protein